MINDEALEAALDAWGGCPVGASPKAQIARILEAAEPHMLAEVTALVSDLTDPDGCSYDHHGGCQAHGYLSLKPGELCPQLEAKAWVHNHRRTL